MENITEIERLVKEAMIVEVNGQKYSASSLEQIKDNRAICCLPLSTLTGMVDFIKSKSEDVTKCILLIQDFDKVSLMSQIDDNSKQRDFYFSAGLRKENSFPFGTFLDVEDFIIKMNSLFKDSPDRKKLIAFVSSLAINNAITSEDDGVTQNVTIKRGMSGALKDTAQSPSVVNLVPFRTFREIEQPESAFLFRMRAMEGRIPACALYEADGGEWKNKAVQGIKEYLNKQELGLTIIA